MGFVTKVWFDCCLVSLVTPVDFGALVFSLGLVGLDSLVPFMTSLDFAGWVGPDGCGLRLAIESTPVDSLLSLSSLPK